MSSNFILEVTAHLITPNKIYYKCPNCWTTKNGYKIFNTNFYKNGKLVENRVSSIHSHGNEKNSITDNWITYRASHCSVKNLTDRNILIKITNKTTRSKYNNLIFN